MGRRSSLLEIRRRCITMFVVMAVIVGMFVSVNFVDNAEAHIDEGIGEPLQLYSFFDSDAGTDIILDGAIARAGSPTDEWDGGYAREINITNGTDYKFAYLLFANDDNYLYIGVVYDSPNASEDNGIQLYFDEGIEPGRYDGSHNDQLDPGKENMIECRGNGSATRQYHDYHYNETGAWALDNASDTDAKDIWDDFDFNVDKGGNYFNWEVKIPLDPKEDTPGEESDLNIGGIDEVGFYIRIWDAGNNTWYYWDMTGPDPYDVSHYADLRLGIEVERDLTIYSTYANTGSPTIDGDISGDFAWANSYERRMILTNFRGETMRATLYACEDPVQGYIYIGMVIYDNETTSGDYLRLYFEEGSGSFPDPYGSRNGILSPAPDEREHFQQLSADGTYIDGFFDPSGAGTWEADDYNGPNNPDNADDGDADVNYRNEIGNINDRYEFEFLVPYVDGTPELLDEDWDLWITSSDLIGFLIRYHDESQSIGEQDFWWDYTTNLDKIQTQETASGVFSAIGWAYLQTGAPALKPITPIDGGTVFGTNYIFRVEAEDEPPDEFDGIDFVGFQMEGETSWISLTRESPSTGIWYTYLDTTPYPDGTYNVTIAAQDNDGITVKNVITINIANGALTPPTITLTSPVKGSTLSNSVEFHATTTGIVSAIELYVGEQLMGTMSSIGADTWQFFLDTTSWSDGTHIISVIARNAAGEGGDAGAYTIDNWDLNSLDIIGPVSGSIVSGTINIMGDFEDDNSGNYAELFVDNEFLASSATPSTLGGGDMGYIFTLDTTLLSEGSHQVEMVVYDPDGNKVTDKVFIIVDNLWPSAPAIVSVLDGQYVEGIFTFQIQSDGTDLVGVDLTIINDDLSTEVVSNVTIGYNSASGYYEYILDTNALQDGNYSAVAYARDSVGKKVPSGPVDFNIDNNLPILVVFSPLDNCVVSDSVNFLCAANDPFLRDVMYKIDSNSWVDINVTWNTSNFVDGARTVRIRARDLSGREALETLTLIVDNNNPTVSIINPLSAQFIGDLYTFKIMANDVVGIDEVRMTINSSDTSSTIVDSIPIGYNAASGHYEYILDTTSLEDGNYSILAIAYDISGYDSYIATANFKIDNTVPELTIISPQNNAFVNSSVIFSVIVEDTFYMDTMYNVDGSGWVDVSTAFDTILVEDGTHAVEIRARDLAGHETTEQIMLIVDNNAPSIGINSPIDEQFLEETFTFQVFAIDDVGIEEVRMTITNMDKASTIINDIPMGYNSATGCYEYTLSISSLEDGSYALSCISHDISGLNSSIAVANFSIDNNLPLLRLINPLDGELLTGNVTIEVSAEDVFLAAVTYRVDGSEWLDIGTSWNTGDVEDGNHMLEIKATDEAGHEVSQTIMVMTDNHAPELSAVSLPNNNQIVGGSFIIQVDAQDASGLENMSYEFDDSESVRMFINKATGFFEANVVTNNTGLRLSDGTHTLNITAVDVAGLETVITRNLTIDNTGPEIAIVNPSLSSNVGGDVEFMVDATDLSGISKVYIRIDKGQWKEMWKTADGLYVYNWNSRRTNDGKYDVDVRAVDALGNKVEESMVVGVDNFPWLWLIGLIVFITVLVVLLAFIVVRRSKVPRPMFPIEEEETPSAPEKPEEEKKEEEELPPPPEKATIVELPEDEEAPPETEEEPSELEEEAPPPKAKPSEEEYEEDMDKLAPPAPEEEYEDEY